MKKLISLTLVLILAMTALIVPATAEETRVIKVGVLTMLNIPEEEMAVITRARSILGRQLVKDAGVVTATGERSRSENQESRPHRKTEIIYYDTLDAMLMALNAGDIDWMYVYESTAQYLCAMNDQLTKLVDRSNIDEDQLFTKIATSGILSNSFAFMLMEGSEALRDEFSAAIADIQADGTRDKLIAEHIDAVIETGEITPVKMPAIEGAQTIKVAITGALPPMDYIAPDGTPAGFNTALLAEISARIGKNIELVQVDSIGRAAALSSGTVDVVFWTRTSSTANAVAERSDEQRAAKVAEIEESLTEEQAAILKTISELVNFRAYGKTDMPEGTIITEPYFTDQVLPVITKASLEARNAQ